MTVIFCVGDGGSLLFNNRRVSSDRVVTEQIAHDYGDKPVRMRACSAKLFADDANILICDDPLDGNCDDICFLESLPQGDWLNKVDRLVLYHWNRNYPADVVLPIEELRHNGRLISADAFAGSSHERIDREVYVL